MEIDYTTRDMTGNPEGITDAVGDWDYTYGADGRLTNATPPAGPIPDQPTGGDYGYDWVGNRAIPPADPNEMVYNAVDQLTSWPGMYDYSYDAAGNLKEVRNAQGVLVASYTYDDSGLLETATYPGGSMTNTWDAMGNRIGLEVGEDEYSFTYDPTAGIPAVIEEVTPGGTVQYFRTSGGLLIARLNGEDWRYYHFDELDSTRLLTDGSGNVTDTYSYDAYGNVTSHNGSTTDNPFLYVGISGYYTHYQATEFKLIQTGYRFYDTEIGRFTQLDPMGDGLNWYAYVGGNPLNYIDPWGLSRRMPGLNHWVPDHRLGDPKVFESKPAAERIRELLRVLDERLEGMTQAARGEGANAEHINRYLRTRFRLESEVRNFGIDESMATRYEGHMRTNPGRLKSRLGLIAYSTVDGSFQADPFGTIEILTDSGMRRSSAIPPHEGLFTMILNAIASGMEAGLRTAYNDPCIKLPRYHGGQWQYE